jgi:hypothetical protein
MRTTRTITASLAAVLGVAALAGPAAAGQQGANDSAKANVYVPPAALSTTAPANGSAKANVYVPPAALYRAALADHSAKANVYVPPAALSTTAPADGSAKANVHAPPSPQPIDRHVAAASPSSSSGFDWGSAGIGAAVVVGAFLVALCGAAGLRRRGQMQPAATG